MEQNGGNSLARHQAKGLPTDTFCLNLNGVVPFRDIISWTESEVHAIKNNFLGLLGKKIPFRDWPTFSSNSDADAQCHTTLGRAEIFVDFQRRLVRTDSGSILINRV